MKRVAGFLAVDLGTTRCKVAIFDKSGSSLGAASSEYGFRSSADSRQHDGSRWRRALKKCVRSVVKQAGSRPLIVSVTGQASSAVCLDRRGKLATPILSHMDRRNLAEHLWVLKEIKHLRYCPSRLFATLAWMKANESERFEKVSRVLDVREYVGYLMTGEEHYDVTEISGREMERFRELTGFDPEKFGTPHEYWAPFGFVSKVAAGEYGLEPGSAVYVGPPDGICGTLGSGVTREGRCADVAGSTEVLASPVPSSSKLVGATSVVGGMSLFYTSPPFGLAHRWFAENIFGGTDSGTYKLMDTLASDVAPGCGGLLYVPVATLQGYMSNFSGHFFNLTTATSRGHLVRAVMEGMAFELGERIRLGESQGLHVTSVVVSGGGAESRTWNQMKADVMGKEVLIPSVRETTCLGAAIIAVAASGGRRDVESIADTMVTFSERFRPRREISRQYGDSLERYRRHAAILKKETQGSR